ncbi:MAG: tRNA (cytidine(56)-2'-O)-methyltransferase [Thaumarchaeota archaeon 13_1_40CM_38_12]|nr:MAG: tRNA (cytidine(56)-2'-O)-methyltransferase [Thaumarchaeota archaeon 13_1_40CM_38_12]OLC33881.1 MAG: tRNA (cytidine(56)-2'-O)-methyltransferase [Thaumarchaeota archaeon 13_1_40CM_4_38_7]OLC91367.1 MAG: tRNA (cytidine(56)-2'-O)-methyltransferase [Thaumarchaeota archaeon 13_1_40CM_3_38_6]OLD30953.1 MAG: tRNA (cytidine(56)-2'-O)-methyltransferase [Thaumarchaeota archaeon 13_1_40CM_2_39_7]TLY08110.1 MAG: tRNA (cytidine(56)-2'-O)-methyltransferase [Nitrososphaerota archaeon]
MKIEVLRIGQRLVRDDRVTTHAALVSRAFGASKILMYDVNPDIKDTISKINRMWGSDFKVEIIENWKEVISSKKKGAFKIVHLTMYGESLNTMEPDLRKEDKILVVIGAEKVPREVYDMADYNIAVGNQPHSEISALAVLLDRVLQGKQLQTKYSNAEHEIIPTKKGKRVMNKTTD